MKNKHFVVNTDINKTEAVRKKKLTSIKTVQNENSFWIWWQCIIIFKVIGLATFSISINTDNNRNGQTHTFVYSKLGTVYNIVLTCLMVGSNYFCILFRYNWQYPNKTPLTTGIEIVQTVLASFSLCGIFLFYCLNQQFSIKVVSKMMEVKHQLGRIDLPIQQKSFFVTVLINVFSNILLFLILFITEILAYGANPIAWITDTVPTFLLGWLYIQYFLVVTYFNARLVEVNRAIQNLSGMNWLEVQQQQQQAPRCLQQTRRVCVSSSSVHHLLQLKDVYGKLCEACAEISDFYAIPVLLAISFTFFTLVYNTYYLVAPFIIDSEALKYMEIVNTIFWIAGLLYPLVLVTTRNTKIIKEFEQTAIIVHQLLDCTIGGGDIKAELKQFSLQLLHRKIQFSVYGLFLFDSSLLHMVLAAVTSYIVILIQFQMGHSRISQSFCNCT